MKTSGTDTIGELDLSPPVLIEEKLLVDIRELVLDAGTQPRHKTDEAAIERYTEAIKLADKNDEENPLPPVDVVVLDDGRHILVRGFQRTAAHLRAKKKEILVNVYSGTLAQAIIYAAGSNAIHGVPRSTKDLEKALAMVLAVPGADKLPNTEIARMIHTSESFVRNHRPAAKSAAVKIVKRQGKTMEVNTSSTGRKGESSSKKKAAKASKAAAKPAASSGAKGSSSTSNGNGNSGGSSSSAPAEDAKLKQAKENISSALTAEHSASYATKVLNGLESGALDLTKREILEWGALSPAMIVRIEPLVTGTGAGGVRMKPYKAYQFLEAGPSEKLMEDLHLLAIGSKDGVYTYKGVGFTVTVEHKKK